MVLCVIAKVMFCRMNYMITFTKCEGNLVYFPEKLVRNETISIKNIYKSFLT